MTLIQLHPKDNIAIASRDLARNAKIPVGQLEITIVEPIKLGHKVAIGPIASGEPVLKFGQCIGFATKSIATGCWLHSHNLEAGTFDRQSRQILNQSSDVPFSGIGAQAAKSERETTWQLCPTLIAPRLFVERSPGALVRRICTGIQTSMVLLPSLTPADAGSNPAASIIEFSTERWEASPGIRTSVATYSSDLVANKQR
jgi:SAF domain